MATLLNATVREVKDLASEFFDKAEVYTTYDKRGKLSHLEARLPRSEFFRLYPPSTTASVYTLGHWLQFSVADQKSYVTSRHTGAKLAFSVECLPWTLPQIVFHKGEKLVLRHEVASLNLDELIETQLGLEVVAKAAARAFERILGSRMTQLDTSRSKSLSVHVLPEELEPEKNTDFQAQFVNLQ